MLIRDFSGLKLFLDFSSRLSKLILDTSGGSGFNLNVPAFDVVDTLFWLSDALVCLSDPTVDSLEGSFDEDSTVGSLVPFEVGFDLLRNDTNLFKCLIYSG